MGNENNQLGDRHALSHNRFATDSMILSADFVADALDDHRGFQERMPKVVYGIRNGLALGLLMWALILLPLVIT